MKSLRDIHSIAVDGLSARPMRSTALTTAKFGLALAAMMAVLFGLHAGLAVAACPNEAFRTGPGAFLPDCRAYEQASPVNKNGAGVSGIRGFTRTPPNGSAITFFNSAGNGFPAQGGNQTYGTYQATKSGASWSLQRLMAPESFGTSANSSWLGSTPDSRYSLVEVEDPAYPSANFGRGLYLFENATGAVTQIVPREANQVEVPYAFDGSSTDGTRFFFETEASLTPDAIGFGDHLYMWDRGSGEVTLVGLLPVSEGGEEPEAGDFGGAYEWFEEQETFTGGALRGLGVEALHAISPTGDQIFFTAGETGQLYLRRGLTSSSPETIHVSGPAPGAPVETRRPAAFQEATPSGSFAFFLSSQKLTEDATTGPADEGKDLYRWDAGSGQLVDIAPDTGDVAGAQVRGVVGIAADGRSGYFVAKGALAPGSVAGGQNLYRFAEAGSEFTITFVATLAPEGLAPNFDQRNFSPRIYAGLPSNPDPEDERGKASRTLSDGSELLFSSLKPLTGYENIAVKNARGNNICPPQSGEGRCGEVFLYSASTESVTCISCNPSGEPPLGSALLNNDSFNTAFVPNNFPNVQLGRNLSADGNHIFFESPDSLVPRDTNAAGGCTSANEEDAPETSRDCIDVYEWEAAGTPGGSCRVVEANGGCLYLLSTGQSPSGSYFLDASENGSNVFIGTTSRLVPGDSDSVYDAYDVKTDGGLASQFAVSEPPCDGEACLGPPNPAPTAGAPASSQVEGPGNVKHQKKKHQKKKHQKKKHQKKKQQSTSRPGNRGRSANTGDKGGN